MDVTVSLEARYQIARDGSVWSQAGMARPFWERYLDVFDRVRVVARATRVENPPEGWLPVTGKNISFCPIPDFLGPWQYLQQYRVVRKAIRAAIPKDGALIMRVGSQIANVMSSELRHSGYPYALEVIGDPYDVFAPGVVEHPLRPFFRWHFANSLRKQCLNAIGVAYVTRHSLQNRYPTRRISESLSDVELTGDAVLGGIASTYFSSIELEASSIAEGMRKARTAGPYRIITVGSLAQMYKGVDVLIEAISLCVQGGLDVSATVVGDGKFRASLEALARSRGVEERLEFAGQLTAGKAVRDRLDQADLFVLPSRTEGLPRALIEAMARGLPCVGSAVGGIPELLAEDDVIPPSNPKALALKIQEVLGQPARMDAMSNRNQAISLEYGDQVLRQRRQTFYRHVLDGTREWHDRNRH